MKALSSETVLWEHGPLTTWFIKNIYDQIMDLEHRAVMNGSQKFQFGRPTGILVDSKFCFRKLQLICTRIVNCVRVENDRTKKKPKSVHYIWCTIIGITVLNFSIGNASNLKALNTLSYYQIDLRMLSILWIESN